MKNNVVYILKNADNGYYVGSTNNIDRRLFEHNSNTVIATKGRGPWLLVFIQEVETTQQARKIEYRLKRLKRRDYIDKIVQEQNISSKKVLLGA